MARTVEDNVYQWDKAKQINDQENYTGYNPNNVVNGQWTATDVSDAFDQFGITSKEHYDLYGADEGLVYGEDKGISTAGDYNNGTGGGGGANITGSATYNLPAYEVPEYKAPEFKAPAAYSPSGNDLVEGRMTGLLNKNSAYMQNARKTGERTAASRGLLNSGLAGEYSQKAAIESALPIAQQDSQSRVGAGMQGSQNTFDAGMKGYQGEIDAAKSALDYGESLGLTREQENASSRISGQDATQKSLLSTQNAGQALDLSAQEAWQTNDNNIRSITAQGAENAKMAAIDSLNSIQKIFAEYGKQSELAGLNNNAERILNNDKISSTEKNYYAQNIQNLGETYLAEIRTAQANQDWDTATKENEVNRINSQYKQDLQFQTDIYQSAIDWTPYTGATDTGTDTGTDTPENHGGGD